MSLKLTMGYASIDEFLQKNSISFLKHCIEEDYKTGRISRGKEYRVKAFLTIDSPDIGFSIARLVVFEQLNNGLCNPRIQDLPFFYHRRNSEN